MEDQPTSPPFLLPDDSPMYGLLPEGSLLAQGAFNMLENFLDDTDIDIGALVDSRPKDPEPTDDMNTEGYGIGCLFDQDWLPNNGYDGVHAFYPELTGASEDLMNPGSMIGYGEVWYQDLESASSSVCGDYSDHDPESASIEDVSDEDSTSGSDELSDHDSSPLSTSGNDKLSDHASRPQSTSGNDAVSDHDPDGNRIMLMCLLEEEQCRRQDELLSGSEDGQDGDVETILDATRLMSPISSMSDSEEESSWSGSELSQVGCSLGSVRGGDTGRAADRSSCTSSATGNIKEASVNSERSSDSSSDDTATDSVKMTSVQSEESSDSSSDDTASDSVKMTSVKSEESSDSSSDDTTTDSVKMTSVKSEESSDSSADDTTTDSVKMTSVKSEESSDSSSDDTATNNVKMTSVQSEESSDSSSDDTATNNVKMTSVKSEESSDSSSDDTATNSVGMTSVKSGGSLYGSSNDNTTVKMVNSIKKKDAKNACREKSFHIIVPPSATGRTIRLPPSDHEQVIHVTPGPMCSEEEGKAPRPVKRKADTEVTPGPSAPKKKAESKAESKAAPKRRASRKGHYQCNQCDEVFTQTSNLCRHKKQRHEPKQKAVITCGICGHIPKRSDYLAAHQRTKRCISAAAKKKRMSLNDTVLE